MQRLIEVRLQEWKDSKRRKPLIVRGARQIGKTYSLEKFGRDHYQAVVKVDLERNRSWHRVFEGDLEARAIVAELEILTEKTIAPGRTLLFIDEIQSCPRAIMALRYLYEEMPDLHVVAAGSLLEFALGEIAFPVGRVQFLEMHPLSFAEYLLAMGKERAAEIVLAEPEPVPESAHRMLMDELRRYFFVGGMPEAVLAYGRRGSMQDSFAVHAELCETYRQDFSRYAPRVDPLILDHVFTGVAQGVGGQIVYSRLAGNHSHSTAKRSFDLLCKAMVIGKVPSATPAGLPLGAKLSANRFKALIVDIGMWQHLSGMRVDAEYVKSDLMDLYRGAMAEQFVGQEMLISQQNDLYYWSRETRGSSAEVDYLAVVDGGIYGVEVKSGSTGRLRSLAALLEFYPNCRGGMVFSSAPFAADPESRVRRLPLYFANSATRSSLSVEIDD